jgi:hypothetical protein
MYQNFYYFCTMKQSKINYTVYKQYYDEGKTDLEISTLMKIPYRTISNYRKNILKWGIVEDNIVLTKEQEEILIGTLLGDTSILYVHSKSKNPHITFSHSIHQQLYFDTKYEKLNILMSSKFQRNYNKNTLIKGKKVNGSMTNYAVGRCLKCLVKYQNIFYQNSKKSIPIIEIEHLFTPISLAYLFMDDGCKNNGTINLNMQSYTLDNLKEFCFYLKNKFNLQFTIKKDKTLYLKYNSRVIFYNLVIPFITEDTKYKLMHLSHL